MSDDSFIREVDEELRSDRMQSIWKRFGKYIIALAALIVVGTAADRGYDYWSSSKASKSGDTFLAALNLAREGQQEEALTALRQLEKEGYGSYSVLARMRAATVLVDTGDFQAAISDFSTIGNDGSVPASVRDIARIKAGYLLVDHGSLRMWPCRWKNSVAVKIRCVILRAKPWGWLPGRLAIMQKHGNGSI